VDLFCPLPVTRIVSSADEVAAALLDLVQRQFAGEGGESVILDSRMTISTRARRYAGNRPREDSRSATSSREMSA
jgi:hypothetical protein